MDIVSSVQGTNLLKQQAISCAYSRDYVNALALINEATTLDPKSSELAIEKAEILCEMGKIDEAITFLSSGTYDKETVVEHLRALKKERALEELVAAGK